jgi:hypothetical protein
MGLFSSVMRSVINPASLMQLAMGPAGWASLAMKTIGTAIAQQLIQQLGQKLGLPPVVIGMAQQAFAQNAGLSTSQTFSVDQAVSGLSRQFNLNPMQEGSLLRGASKLSESINKMVYEQIKNASQSEEVREIVANGKKFRKPGQPSVSDSIASRNQGILMKLATALGKLMDQKMDDMSKLTDEIGRLGQKNANDLRAFGEVKSKNQNQYDALRKEGDSQLATMNGQLQGLAQEMNMLSQALSTTIKTIGEANAAMARKG